MQRGLKVQIWKLWMLIRKASLNAKRIERLQDTELRKNKELLVSMQRGLKDWLDRYMSEQYFSRLNAKRIERELINNHLL